MDISAIVLNKLILERDIDIWAKLKLAYLDSAYSTLYSAVSRHYDKFAVIPSFDELELSLREGPTKNTLAMVRMIDEPDISADVALTALIDQYTQDITVGMLDKFVDKLPVYDTHEIKENLANIVLTLDEKTLSSETVYNMADLMLFQSKDDLASERLHLGLNNLFDSVLNGMAREEYLLIGGKRGSGKSITGSNIVVNQFEAGNVAVLFTIEMTAREVNERNMSILAGVSHIGLKNGTLSKEEWLKVVKARASMFVDATSLIDEYVHHNDRFKFEHDLIKTKQLKPDNQIIIVDDSSLTLSSIDLHLGKLKAKFKDKFTVCVVDYLNQIVIEGASQFDWQPQITISKKLKDLARKHQIVMVSPYQIDASGEARFAKGILDSADIALVMEAHGKDDGSAIQFNTTKIRGGPPLNFTSPINWDSLRIDSTNIDTPINSGEKKKKKKDTKADEPATDLPWDA